MAKVEDGEDDEDSMVKVVVAEDIEDGATKAASAKDGMAWFKFKMLKLLDLCLVKMTKNNSWSWLMICLRSVNHLNTFLKIRARKL